MPNENAYIRYKRDTRFLVYWVINTSNAIIRAHCVADDEGKPLQPTTTGHVTISTMLAMARRIARFTQSTPTIIFRLLKSVIQIRTSFYEQYRSSETSQLDRDLERSNKSHKVFIDALSTVFSILGGQKWEQSQEFEGEDPLEGVQSLEVMFGNMFSALSSDATTAHPESDYDSDEVSSIHVPVQKQNRKKSRKARKPAKGKKGKKRYALESPTNSPFDYVSLDDCGILGDGEDSYGAYFMATHALADEWASLRTYIRDIWHEVAYEGFNSVVAAAQSNMAVSMIQQAQLAIFADFPNRDGYASLIRTFRSEPKDNTRSQRYNWYPIFMVANLYGPNKEYLGRESGLVDMAEQVMAFAYHDLLDFITDYRKNRNGKPTRAMQAEIDDWNPKFDLQQASFAQRLAWRRQYTIKWLYDLVNLYAYPAFEHRASTQSSLALENVDWSPGGICGKRKSLFGFTDFACFVTGLVMQKPGTSHESKILPHHVFQLQCVVDSFTVSRGWLLHYLEGHVLEHPAFFYDPPQDIRAFVYGDKASHRPGFIQGASKLKQLLQEQHQVCPGLNNYNVAKEAITSLESELSQWLTPIDSRKPLAIGWQLQAPGCKGLLQHSPWLCGDGLIQALNMAFRTGMVIWESIPEPMMLTLLHKMLVEEGLLEDVGILGEMKNYFPDTIQFDGCPVSNPFSKWMRPLAGHPGDRSRSQASDLRSRRRRAAMSNPGPRLSYRTKSQLIIYEESEWCLARVPDSALWPQGNLWQLRFSQTPVLVNSVTGEEKLKDTAIVCRLRELQFPEDSIRELFDQAKEFEEMIVATRAKPLSRTRTLLEGRDLQNVRLDVHACPREKPKNPEALGLADVPRTDVLTLLQNDIYHDVCGALPLSGLDYLALTIQFMSVFADIEKRLDKTGDTHSSHIHNNRSGVFKSERVGFTWVTLFGGSQDCWPGIADSLRASNLSVSSHSIWKELDPEAKKLSGVHERTAKDDKCCVM